MNVKGTIAISVKILNYFSKMFFVVKVVSSFLNLRFDMWELSKNFKKHPQKSKS